MSTRAIRALVQIMQDKNMPTSSRIEACAGLLEYEAPTDVVELAKEFLTSIFEDEERTVRDRLDATTLMRKFEAPRVSRPTVRVDMQTERNRTEEWREYEIGQRKFDLIKKGVRPPFPLGWDDDLRSAEYVPPPEGWPPRTPMEGMAEAVRRRRMRVIEGDKP